MEVLGKSPINKYLYASGKLSSFAADGALILQFFGLNFRIIDVPPAISLAALILASIGFMIFIFAMLNLGSSMRFGLPTEPTRFKTEGLYSFSRNPMYLGFFLILFASIIYTANPVIAVLAVYGIYIHHLIALSEEKFLKERFGQRYLDYCGKTGRYI
jgi:protein-S-isoprenylcysteine O-methyltransferase Ste14